jgi:dienelactone hydrolase
MRAAEQMGSPVDVDLAVYPGATHGFTNVAAADPAQVAAWAEEYPDVVAVPGGLRYLGHLIKYDAEATADSIVRVEAFLAEHLGRGSAD